MVNLVPKVPTEQQVQLDYLEGQDYLEQQDFQENVVLLVRKVVEDLVDKLD